MKVTMLVSVALVVLIGQACAFEEAKLLRLMRNGRGHSSPAMKENSAFTIQVNAWDSKGLGLDVHSDDTVLSVKQAIFAWHKVPVEKQLLYLQDSKRGSIKLEDDKTLGYYNMNGYTYLRLYEPTSAENSAFILQINAWDSKGLGLDVHSHDTVLSVKQAILAWHKVPVEKQLLYLQDSKRGNIKLEDDKTLGYYNMNEYSYLRLYEPTSAENSAFILQINAWDSKGLGLDVHSHDTVLSVKQAILAWHKVPVEKQLLYLQDSKRGNIKLEDDKTLGYYNMNEYSYLRLYKPTSVEGDSAFVIQIDAWDSRGLGLNAHSEDTILSIKKAIFDWHKVPVEKQLLYMEDIKLEDDKTCGFYKMNDLTHLTLYKPSS